ncbi:hypothetical protein P8S54_09590 [Thiomicrospira sp. R3]|uniref:hypothetical protein n=1 Tax=Thiomicrospira sp. R3 TaxID=3035472 RepID=UPI00259B0749|nr:hypothetical protein [Thiomicrospira sp. R3]WFE68448.1 hypothetical protein P8S54_09590 [Thiomicrospira sp. R3]
MSQQQHKHNKDHDKEPNREPMLELFRYGQLPKLAHRGLLFASLAAALYWLYFSIVKMELLPRLLAGETLILDAIVGFPLVLALAIVVYAIVYWAIKIVMIIAYPHWLTLPPGHNDPDEVAFDPADKTDLTNPRDSKRDS